MALSPKQIDDVLESIAVGNSVRSSISNLGCRFSTFYDQIQRDPDLADRYARARQLQAEASQGKIVELADRTVNGEVDPAAARVAIDALKWNAARLHPAIYGERVAVDQKTTHEVGSSVELLLEKIRGKNGKLELLP